MALTKRDQRRLRQLRRQLEMGSCGFAQLAPTDDDPLPKSEDEVTEFIRRRTQLWRESWLLPLIDAVLEGRK